MTDATVCLVSSDSSLVESAKEAVAQVHDARLRVLSSYAQLGQYLDEVSLVLAPISSQTDADHVAGWLERVRAQCKPIPTLLICDREQSDLALPLLRLGAVDCFDRPLDLGRLAYLVDMLTMRARLAPRPVEAPNTPQFLGQDKSFLSLPSSPSGDILKQVSRIAPLDTTIMLVGETGTGKSRMARLIHEISPRRDEPFLVVHSSGLSANVIESEMFGHIKGSFTGADRDRIGKFAEAGAGTILLDDIDALQLDLQAKLLRVVEDRVFEQVGSNRTVPMKARLIVASNRMLSEEAAAGRFRSDLYYRLSVVSFFLPPLRENIALVPPLALKFLEDFSERMRRPIRDIAPDAMRALQEHYWPGNIRELRNVIERAVALGLDDVVRLHDLPPDIAAPTRPLAAQMSAAPAFNAALTDPVTPSPTAASGAITSPPSATPLHTLADAKQAAEAARIAQALARNHNNRLRAAAELGISRMTLYKKMHIYGLMDAMPA